jgi:lysophospholipase L1-like esterase
MKILTIADSLAMPRKEGNDVVLWNETWVYILEKELRKTDRDIQIVNRAERAKTMSSLEAPSLFSEYVELFQPDTIIIQLGVVDSMPRIFSLDEQKILNLQIRSRFLIPDWLKKQIISNRTKRRQTITAKNPLKKVYTVPEKFPHYLSAFINRCRTFNPDIKFLIIPILTDEQRMDSKSPGSTGNKNLYNSLLNKICAENRNVQMLNEEVFRVVSAKIFCSDGYHLNKEGNLLLAEEILKKLEIY